MPDAKPSLTPKHALFVECYFACNMNATRAAVRAGYSEASAYSQGSRLLKNDEISAAISRRLAESAMAADEVLARLADMGRADMADFLDIPPPDEDLSEQELAIRNADRKLAKQYPGVPGMDPMTPTLNLARAAKAGKMHMLRSFKPGEFGTEITLVDSQGALTTLAKHHGLLTAKVEQTGEALDMLRRILSQPDDEDDDLAPCETTEGHGDGDTG